MYALEHYEQAVNMLPQQAFKHLIEQMLPRLRRTVGEQLTKVPAAQA